MSNDHMKCPDCAETIRREAMKCRFCGRAITKADRMGYPSFYNEVLSDGFDSPYAILSDYAHHVHSDDWEKVNLMAPISWLLDYGNLEEWDHLDRILEALFNRARELGQKERLDGLGEIEKAFSRLDNKELKAVFLSAKYIRRSMYFSKEYGDGEDLRENLSNLESITDSVSELRHLAATANPKMVGFIEQLDREIAALRAKIDEIKGPAVKAQASATTSAKKRWWQF